MLSVKTVSGITSILFKVFVKNKTKIRSPLVGFKFSWEREKSAVMFKSALCSAASFEFGIKAGIYQLMLPKLKSPASIMFPVSLWENLDNEASNLCRSLMPVSGGL